MVNFQARYAIFLHDDNPFIQICIFEKIIHSSPTKIAQIKNNYSYKVQNSCTIYKFFFSKVQQPNKKLRLIM